MLAESLEPFLLTLQREDMMRYNTARFDIEPKPSTSIVDTDVKPNLSTKVDVSSNCRTSLTLLILLPHNTPVSCDALEV